MWTVTAFIRTLAIEMVWPPSGSGYRGKLVVPRARRNETFAEEWTKARLITSAARPCLFGKVRQIVHPIFFFHSNGINHVRQIVLGVSQNK